MSAGHDRKENKAVAENWNFRSGVRPEAKFWSSVYRYHIKLREWMEALLVSAKRGKQRTRGWGTATLRGHRQQGNNSQDTRKDQHEPGVEPEGCDVRQDQERRCRKEEKETSWITRRTKNRPLGLGRWKSA